MTARLKTECPQCQRKLNIAEKHIGRKVQCPGCKNRWVYTPHSEGYAPLPEFIARLKQLDNHGVTSLHSEYNGSNSFKKLTTQELLKQSQQDLVHLKKLGNKHNLQ